MILFISNVFNFRVLISNINLAIQNMYNYVNKIAVSLPEDRKKDAKDQAPLENQLEVVFSHIKDLEEVNHRVGRADKSKV